MARKSLDIGLRIKIERMTRRIRQRELARRIGIAPNTLSDIENGWKRPSDDLMRRICQALEIQSDDLVGEP